VLAALLVAVPALLLGGWLASKLGWRSSEAKEPPTPDSADAELIGRLEGEIAALRSDLERARGEAAESAGLKTELEHTRGDVASRIESLERALALAQAAAAPSEAATPPASIQTSSAQAPAPAENAVREPRGSEAANSRPQPTPADPGELANLRASGFDRALGSLESGRGGEALGRLEGLIARRVFSGLENDGSALLWSLCSGASELAGNGTSNASSAAGPDAPALAKARAALERSSALRPAFAQAAASWLGAAQPAYTADERLERLDFALERLGQEIGWASAELDARHTPDWERIRALGVPQDPAQVVQHATSFACEHVAELCARTADAYNVSCLWSGDVDRKGLANASHLAAWGRLALAHQPDARSDAETDLMWLWYAQRWFVNGEAAETFDWTGLAAPEAVAPSEDWRAELRLAIELAASHFSWPGGVGARALYRVESSGPARWRVDEMRRVERDGAGWQIDRTHFDAQGKPLGSRAEVRIERDGDVYRYTSASGVLLDLRASGANVSVAHGDLPSTTELPALEGLDLGSFGDHEAFAAAAQRSCLVYQDGEWTRWFAPGLGLVREVRNGPEGAVRVELAALGAMP
jgi:hypothetical protein